MVLGFYIPIHYIYNMEKLFKCESISEEITRGNDVNFFKSAHTYTNNGKICGFQETKINIGYSIKELKEILSKYEDTDYIEFVGEAEGETYNGYPINESRDISIVRIREFTEKEYKEIELAKEYVEFEKNQQIYKKANSEYQEYLKLKEKFDK